MGFNPETVIRAISIGPLNFTLYHIDPCTDGTDSSCGWFMRARHCDQDIRRRVQSAFRFEMQYWFHPETGEPQMSMGAIALAMFRWAAWEYFKHDHRKTDRWVQSHCAEILMFAENSIDSLFRPKFQLSEQECAYRGMAKQEVMDSFADCVLSYIYRDMRPWWKHPRWHVWHWKLACPQLGIRL